MENWNLYKDGDNINVKNELARQIIEKLAKEVLKSIYSSDSPIVKRGERTAKIFEALTLMGDDKKCKVYSHSLSKEFVNREWLYDLLWYKEDDNEGYCPIDFPLVVESEWEKKRREDKRGDPHSGIKYDFQKLLLSNSGLRLMIFKISKEEELNQLSEYFNNAITKYRPLKKGEFLFIAFQDKKESFHYCYQEKVPCNCNTL